MTKPDFRVWAENVILALDSVSQLECALEQAYNQGYHLGLNLGWAIEQDKSYNIDCHHEWGSDGICRICGRTK